MADKNSLNNTEDLRAAIAELQARIEARDRQREESDNLENSWIHKEDNTGMETGEEVYAGLYEGTEYQEDTDGYGDFSADDSRGSYDDAAGQSQEPFEDERESALTERKKRIIRETTGEDAEFEAESEHKDIPARERRGEKARGEAHLPKEQPQHETRSVHPGTGGKKRRNRTDGDVIISLKNVSKSYVKDVPALSNVNIQIRRGEFVFIVGSSGSGKSTLIRLLLRELKPTSGSIMVNGLQVDKLRRGKIPKLRRSMGVVFQDFRLLKDRNVYENVAFAQRIIQIPVREMKRNVPNMLATVGLAGKYKANPDELSGGEQQRVAIARALVNRPPILVADEPTGNLDPKNTMEIMHLLEKINESGTTVIVVTHDDKMVDEMKKRVITIRKGVVISDEEKGGYSNEG